MLTEQTLAREVSSPVAKPRVRCAVTADYPQLMDLCAELHDENGISEVDWDMVGSTLMKGIVGDGASIGIIGAVHNVQAAIYLSINHFWYSSQSVLMELFSYVRPEYRRSSNAKVLLEF